MFARRQVLTTTNTRTGGTRRLQNLSDLMIQLIGRCQIVTTGRENHHPQQTRDHTVREVGQQIVHRLFSLIQRVLYAPVHQRQIHLMAAFIVIAFQHRRGEEHLT